MGYMFRFYRVIFRPSKTTDPIITRGSSALWDPQCLHNSIVTIQNTVPSTNFAGEVLRCTLWSPYFRYNVNKGLQVQDPVLDL